jgi:hypothetical protein
MGTSSNTAARTLHLVDLENLVGDPHATGPIVRHTFERYLELAGWVHGDHVIVASNPWMIADVAFDLTVPSSVHAAHGRDGADVMLLSLAPPELVVKRYGRLVVGSGDGIFAARATHAHDLGVRVLVVARDGGCSWMLRRFEHRLLTDELSLAA